MKKMLLRLPSELHEQLKALALQERRSLNAQVVRALEEWIAEQKQEPR